ncbi:MAG: translation initiation factor IF-2 N-terminal domain-containing protein [Candidatus Uhrbacteria bacterium]
MNVSELARRVNLLPQELYDILPRYGFDVGRRAIKMDDRLAQRFLRDWPRIRRDLQRLRDKERQEEERKRRQLAVAEGNAREVALPPIVTVRDFADRLALPVSEVIHELLRNGILANLNERIDYATAAIIAEDLGCKPVPEMATSAIAEVEQSTVEATATAAALALGGIARPPVVVVMGHVDHGKTKLLDAIRKTDVAGGEAGGITQHIGAYQATIRPATKLSSRPPTTDQPKAEVSPDGSEGRKITFIDTPGHQAFTTMRSRGARVADVAVLVVAADDGVQPQTKEALEIIRAAKLPFVVAMNKVDKPEANVERVMQELGAMGVTSEAWGGKVPFVSVSAKAVTGIDDLLEVILLVADLERDRLLADPTAPAITATIESRVDKNEGPVATLLVQQGTLRVGDVLAVGKVFMGKIRSLRDYRGQIVAAAPPSMPVRVLGFKVLPEVGDVVTVAADQRALEVVRRKTSGAAPSVALSSPVPVAEGEEPAIILPVVLRADVLGSLEAIASEVEKIGGAQARVKVIGRGLGNITEGDIAQVAAAKGQVLGFGVRAPDDVAKLARDQGVLIVTSKIIYDLLGKVRAALEALLPEEIVREQLGTVRTLALFRKENRWQIVGCKVIAGKIVMEKGVKAELIRGGDVAAEGKLFALQAGKEEVREVVVGQECGMKIGGIEGIQIGDELRFVKEERQKKKLG